MTDATQTTAPSTTVTTSEQYKLNWRDVAKALLVAAITPVVPIVLTSLNAGTFVIDWKLVGTTALSAAVAYLAKNFFTPSQIVITKASS